jgi:hypothetical protein
VHETIVRGCVQLVVIFDLVVLPVHCSKFLLQLERRANTFGVDSQCVSTACAPLAGTPGAVVDQTTGSLLYAHALRRHVPGPGIRRAAGETLPHWFRSLSWWWPPTGGLRTASQHTRSSGWSNNQKPWETASWSRRPHGGGRDAETVPPWSRSFSSWWPSTADALDIFCLGDTNLIGASAWPCVRLPPWSGRSRWAPTADISVYSRRL